MSRPTALLEQASSGGALILADYARELEARLRAAEADRQDAVDAMQIGARKLHAAEEALRIVVESPAIQYLDDEKRAKVLAAVGGNTP